MSETMWKQYRVVPTGTNYIRGFGGKVAYCRINDGRVIVRVCRDTGGPPVAATDGAPRRDSSLVTMDELEYIRFKDFLPKAIEGGEAMEAVETSEEDEFALVKIGEKLGLRLMGKLCGGRILAQYKLAAFSNVVSGSVVPTWGESAGCDFTLNELRSFADAIPLVDVALLERKGALFVTANGSSLLDRIIDLCAEAVFDKFETELVRLDPNAGRVFSTTVAPFIGTVEPHALIDRLFATDRCKAHDASIGGLQEALAYMGTTDGQRKVIDVLKPQVTARRDAMRFVSGQLQKHGYDMAASTPPPPTPSRGRTLRTGDGPDSPASMQPPRAPKRRAPIRRLCLDSSDEEDSAPSAADKA